MKATDVVDPSPEGTVAKPDNLIVVNPAIVQRPSDGKYLLYFKGNIYDPRWRGVHGVAVGDSPTGPFSASDTSCSTAWMRKAAAPPPRIRTCGTTGGTRCSTQC